MANLVACYLLGIPLGLLLAFPLKFAPPTLVANRMHLVVDL